MSSKIVQLVDKDGNNVFPVTASSVDFTTIGFNSYLENLQSTTDATGATTINILHGNKDLGNIPITLKKKSNIRVTATFPLSATGGIGFVDLYMDDKAIMTVCMTENNTSDSITGEAYGKNVAAGTHTLSFRLRASSGATAYLGKNRTISVIIAPTN